MFPQEESRKQCLFPKSRTVSSWWRSLDLRHSAQKTWKSFPVPSGWDNVLQMWSGGRSLKSIAYAGIFAALQGSVTGQTPLCDQQHPGNPELIMGAASCFYNEINGGQTLIQLTSGSIIRWDHLGLQNASSSLVFEWLAGPDAAGVVLNQVEQAGRQEAVLAGSLSFPDGHLVITHPNTGLNILGAVEAGSVTVVTQNLNAQASVQLMSGEAANFMNADPGSRLNIFGGKVSATSGDVVLGGAAVLIGGSDNGGSEILAPAGAVRIFGGQSFRLLPESGTAGSARIERLPGSVNGNILNTQVIRAGQMVEITSEAGISNSGVLQADQLGGIVMMRVDEGGTLINEGGALISADIIMPFPTPGPGAVLNPDRGDAPSPLSTGLSRIPVVSSPGQSGSSRRVIVRESAPVTGSASSQRQRANRTEGDSKERKNVLAGNMARRTGYLARGRSFFGTRGGSTAKKR